MRGSDRVLAVLRQLTSRDRVLLELLYDHQVLTTDQISDALFPNLDTAQHRLVKLVALELLERFRPLREGGGSFPFRYTIGRLGAEFVAARRGEEPPRRDRLVAARRRLATSPTLEHTLDTNGFFVAPLAHARAHPDSGLLRWWSGERCSQWHALATGLRPQMVSDGHGVWAEEQRAVGFYLEHDTGTESLTRLLDKLRRYELFAAEGGPGYPVLFWLHSSAREHRLHTLIAGERDLRVPVATAARDRLPAPSDPADGIWMLHGNPGAAQLRRRADLPGQLDDVERARLKLRRPA